MAKIRGNKARFYIDEEDIYLKSFEFDHGMEVTTVDASVYGDEFDSFEPIKARGTFNIQARIVDDYRAPGDVADQLLDKFFHGRIIDPGTGLVVTTPAVLSMILSTNTPAEGGDGIFTRGYGNMGINPARDGLASIRAQFTETGPIHRGKILRVADVTLTDLAPTDNGPAVALAGAANYIRSSLHIVKYNITGSVTDVTAKIQSDDASGFPSPTDRLTFAAATARTKEWKEVLGAWSAETHHRLVLTGTGTGSWSVTVGVVCIAATG